MSFLDSLNRLQKAPANTRRAVAAALVISIMSLIIGLWALQLKATMYNGKHASAAQAAEPFKILWEEVKAIKAGK